MIGETNAGRILNIVMTSVAAESGSSQRGTLSELTGSPVWRHAQKSMEYKFEIPKFESETDEANWWYDNRERVSEEFQKAAADGICAGAR